MLRLIHHFGFRFTYENFGQMHKAPIIAEVGTNADPPAMPHNCM